VAYETKDNEFVAWYPNAVTAEAAQTVWQPRSAAYYVHIPFCTAICDYCGFAIQRLKEGDSARYLTALRAEIEKYASSGRLDMFEFQCGHFGGGTPSAIHGNELVEIKRLIDRSFRVTPDAEVTVEVNPISFTFEKAKVFKEAGVNRISFGVQSFDDETLRTIGRPHRARDVDDTITVLRETGYDNFSLDIIYGVPGQRLRQLERDIERVCETEATHVSAFRLEIIPFTELKLRDASGQLPQRVPREILDEMDDLVSERLRAAGYLEYGAFNYAKPGFQSVHNRLAFIAPQGEYVGFGNSAYSFVEPFVYCNHADIQAYENEVFSGRDPISLARSASALELMSRYFVLGLKFFVVPRAPFVRRFGIDPEMVFGAILSRLINEGFLTLNKEQDSYVLTGLGRKYINNVVKEFFVGDNRGRRQHVQFVPTLTPEAILRYVKGAPAQILGA
jgi:oxygen-independent coproporphyrinogen-3 oxidase